MLKKPKMSSVGWLLLMKQWSANQRLLLYYNVKSIIISFRVFYFHNLFLFSSQWFLSHPESSGMRCSNERVFFRNVYRIFLLKHFFPNFYFFFLKNFSRKIYFPGKSKKMCFSLFSTEVFLHFHVWPIKINHSIHEN